MKKLSLDEIENLSGGSEGTTCLITGAFLLANPLLVLLTSYKTVKYCWNT